MSENNLGTTTGNQLRHVISVVIVLAFSLVLLVYIGLGEARRTYPTFILDKLAAQGELVKTSMDTFLLANLPVDQFPGFSTLTDPLLASDDTITAVYVTDTTHEVLLLSVQPGEDFDPTTEPE